MPAEAVAVCLKITWLRTVVEEIWWDVSMLVILGAAGLVKGYGALAGWRKRTHFRCIGH